MVVHNKWKWSCESIALHQGLDTSSDRNAMKRDYSDLNFNQYCEKMQRIQGFYMSIPGDKVACSNRDGGSEGVDWNNDQRLVFENWNNAEGRDRKRSRLLYEVRYSNRQMPTSFVKIESSCVCYRIPIASIPSLTASHLSSQSRFLQW